jgi:hypothetical protein
VLLAESVREMKQRQEEMKQGQEEINKNIKIILERTLAEGKVHFLRLDKCFVS